MHLTGCYGIALSGNTIYSCENRNLLIEDSRLINVSGNTFRRHTPRYGTGVRFTGSSDITFTGCGIHDETAEGQPDQRIGRQRHAHRVIFGTKNLNADH